MRISVRSLVCGVAAFVVGLIALTGLCSDVIGAKEGIKIGENGFDMFDFKSNLFFTDNYETEWISYMIAPIAILACIVGIVAMVFGALSVFFKKFEGAAKGLTIVSLIASLLYMIVGIIGLSVFNDKASGAIKDYTYTSAFIPFIFSVLFTVAYFVCLKKVPDKQIYATVSETYARVAENNGMQRAAVASCFNPVEAARTSEAQSEVAAAYSAPAVAENISEAEKVQLLRDYAQLLKDGIITQEEFDAKKKELL